MELAGRKPLARFIAVAKLGVPGLPKVGLPTLADEGLPTYIDEGRANREVVGEVGGMGLVRPLEAREGIVPVYFFCVRVKEKMACDRDDWAFMSVSFVRRMEEPCLMRDMTSAVLFTGTSLNPLQRIVPSFSSRIWTSRLEPLPSSKASRSMRSSL